MIPFLLAVVGGYFIGDSMGSEKFADGGTMWRVEPSTPEEDMDEMRELIGQEKFDSLSSDERKKMVDYLKAKGEIGLPGKEEDIEDISGLQYYAKGGNVSYYHKDKEHRLGRPSGSIEYGILEKVKYYAESGNFVGNFGWKTPSNKLGDGYLYTLDDLDKDLVKSIKLKEGEKIFRYFNRTTAIGGMTPLIKINLDKGLLYFPKEEGDKVFFDAKGVKALWINIIQHKL
ncbi:MAG: hypothetical protein EBZ47_07415 [Chlamydiae bacterium]|nr:hypothetical protein [Chlamydiota bacterium]